MVLENVRRIVIVVNTLNTILCPLCMPIGFTDVHIYDLSAGGNIMRTSEDCKFYMFFLSSFSFYRKSLVYRMLSADRQPMKVSMSVSNPVQS